MPKKSNGRRGYLTPYKSYVFREKDPVIDKLRTIVSDSDLSLTAIHDKSGVSTSTMWNWFHGKTRRPQFATVTAVARVCGQDVVFRTFHLSR